MAGIDSSAERGSIVKTVDYSRRGVGPTTKQSERLTRKGRELAEQQRVNRVSNNGDRHLFRDDDGRGAGN